MRTGHWIGWTAVAWALPVLGAGESKEPGSMGVTLGPVPEALAVHLGIERNALMVLNVVVGSPADFADLRRYDVIVEFNGQPVPGDYTEFAEVVRETGAKTKVQLKLYREGKSKTMELVLGERSNRRPEYKYEEQPEEILRDHFDVAGKILRRMPDGRWQLEDLWGDSLPPQVREYFRKDWPGLNDVDRWVWKGGDRWKSRVRESEDGSGVEVERHEDGKITVRRFTREGDVEKVKKDVYQDEEALKAGDRQAYDVYMDMKTGRKEGRLRRGPGDVTFDRERWIDELTDRMQQAMRGGAGGRDREPSTSFSVTEDGKIEVTIRGRDGELKQTYKDEADLQMRDADLHKRYAAIKSTGAKAPTTRPAETRE